MFKEGDFVRHRAKPDWGAGKVTAVTTDKIEIRFSHGHVTLKLDVAAPLLEAAPAPVNALRGSSSRASAHAGAATSSRGSDRTAPCESCHTPLNRSRRSRDGQWKSCPDCSVRDGAQHVFYPYPDSFGVSQARVTGEDADGAQSYCSSCRGRGSKSIGAGRSCAQFDGLLEV